jgi:hypothetical protein
LNEYAFGVSAVLIVTYARNEDSAVPQPGTEHGKIGSGSAQSCTAG